MVRARRVELRLTADVGVESCDRGKGSEADRGVAKGAEFWIDGLSPEKDLELGIGGGVAWQTPSRKRALRFSQYDKCRISRCVAYSSAKLKSLEEIGGAEVVNRI